MEWMKLVNKVLTYRYNYFPPTWQGWKLVCADHVVSIER